MIGTLEADRLILAVKLDRNGEEKFQPTVLPDVAWVQHKAFNPGRAREHELESSWLYPWYYLPGPGPGNLNERLGPALKTLMSLVNSVANSRNVTIIDGKTSFCVRYF